MNEVADVLEAAADIIRERGWTQGDDNVAFSQRDATCAALAIDAAARDGLDLDVTADFRTYVLRVDAGKDAFASHLGLAYHQIPRWNDDPGRTVEDVLSALKQAAYEARM